MYYNKDSIVFLNGGFVKPNQKSVDWFSQTLHYGYGVFEGIRAYQTHVGTRVFKAEEHYDRLKNSAQLLGIPFDYSTEELCLLTDELLLKNKLSNAYVRPLVFCEPNMSLSKPKSSSLLIAAWKWGAYLGEKNLRVMTSSYCRPHPKSVHIEAKACGHYVNSTLATSEAHAKGYDEALLLDSDGYVAEGSGANLFFEKDGTLFTPQLGNILPRITRQTVLELAEKSNLKVKQGLFRANKLREADSAFYCGTAAGIIGLESVDDYKFPKPWKDSLGYQLQTAYEKLVREPKTKLKTL